MSRFSSCKFTYKGILTEQGVEALIEERDGGKLLGMTQTLAMTELGIHEWLQIMNGPMYESERRNDDKRFRSNYAELTAAFKAIRSMKLQLQIPLDVKEPCV